MVERQKQQKPFEEPPYNGILCIDKPRSYTSFDVIARMRGILKVKRLGHAGTLDPMATGVLPILVGRATRACDILPDQEKAYRASFQLGLTSDTQDIWGKVTAREGVPKIAQSQLEVVLDGFRGQIQQLPPMYSALQVGGQRLYDLARQGIEVEREKRSVEITRLQLLEFSAEQQRGVIEVQCSKGTYIRTLCHDIGQALGCGAVMTALRRIQAAGFSEKDCVTLEQLERLVKDGRMEDYLHPVGEAFAPLAPVWLDTSRTRMFLNGVPLDLRKIRWPDVQGRGTVRVMGSDGSFLGTGELDREAGVLRAQKIFVGR